jgi:hypothetical protein
MGECISVYGNTTAKKNTLKCEKIIIAWNCILQLKKNNATAYTIYSAALGCTSESLVTASESLVTASEWLVTTSESLVNGCATKKNTGSLPKYFTYRENNQVKHTDNSSDSN